MHESQYHFYAQDKHLAPIRSLYILYLVSQFLLERAKKSGIFISPFTMDFAMSLVSRNVDGFELSLLHEEEYSSTDI